MYIVGIESVTYPGAIAAFQHHGTFNRFIDDAIVFEELNEAIERMEWLKHNCTFKAPEQLGTLFAREQAIKIYPLDVWEQTNQDAGIKVKWTLRRD